MAVRPNANLNAEAMPWARSITTDLDMTLVDTQRALQDSLNANTALQGSYNLLAEQVQDLTGRKNYFKYNNLELYWNQAEVYTDYRLGIPITFTLREKREVLISAAGEVEFIINAALAGNNVGLTLSTEIMQGNVSTGYINDVYGGLSSNTIGQMSTTLNAPTAATLNPGTYTVHTYCTTSAYFSSSVSGYLQSVSCQVQVGNIVP